MKKKILSVFIAIYIVLIYFAGVPATNTFMTRFQENTRAIVHALGIWPSWSMFAPNPIKYDSNTFVKIKYNDGSEVEYDVEEKPTGILGPFRAARWNKYSQDNLKSDKQRGLLRPTLNYFTKKYQIADKKIVYIALVQKWQDVPPYGDGTNILPVLENKNLLPASKVLIEDNYESH
jgi:hypothetical protein